MTQSMINLHYDIHSLKTTAISFHFLSISFYWYIKTHPLWKLICLVPHHTTVWTILLTVPIFEFMFCMDVWCEKRKIHKCMSVCSSQATRFKQLQIMLRKHFQNSNLKTFKILPSFSIAKFHRNTWKGEFFFF